MERRALGPHIEPLTGLPIFANHAGFQRNLFHGIRQVRRDKKPLRVSVYSTRYTISQGTFMACADFATAVRSPTWQQTM